MKKIIITFVAITTMIFSGYCQNQNPSFSSNPTLSFDKYISGVKHATIGLNALNQEQVDNQTGIAGLYYLAQNYLQQMGFEYVALTSTEKTKLDIEITSYCEYTQVMIGGDINKNSISNMSISFVTCEGDIFSFSSDKIFKYGKFTDVENKLVKDWQSLFNTKGKYKSQNQLRLPANPTAWTKDKLVAYFNDNKGKLDPIEGIYERVRLSFEDITGGKYTIGVIKDPEANGYKVIYLSGAKNSNDWISGEAKASFSKTATKGFYSVYWISRDKSLYEDVYCNEDTLGFSVYSSGMLPISYKFIKILPVND